MRVCAKERRAASKPAVCQKKSSLTNEAFHTRCSSDSSSSSSSILRLGQASHPTIQRSTQKSAPIISLRRLEPELPLLPSPLPPPAHRSSSLAYLIYQDCQCHLHLNLPPRKRFPFFSPIGWKKREEEIDAFCDRDPSIREVFSTWGITRKKERRKKGLFLWTGRERGGMGC